MIVPDDLSEDERVEFERFVALVGSYHLEDCDSALVAIYARAAALASGARRTLLDQGLTVVHKGKLMANPVLQVLHQAETAQIGALRELRCTPLSRVIRL